MSRISMSKRYTIQVRQYPKGTPKYQRYKAIYCVLETITRVMWAEAIGNFNPMFCTYKHKRTLVQSDEGDLSDPFRRDETYADTLYIEVEDYS